MYFKCRNGAFQTGSKQVRQSQVLIWHDHEIRAMCLQKAGQAISNTNNGNIIGGAWAWQYDSNSLLTRWRHMTENQGSGCSQLNINTLCQVSLIASTNSVLIKRTDTILIAEMMHVGGPNMWAHSSGSSFRDLWGLRWHLEKNNSPLNYHPSRGTNRAPAHPDHLCTKLPTFQYCLRLHFHYTPIYTIKTVQRIYSPSTVSAWNAFLTAPLFIDLHTIMSEDVTEAVKKWVRELLQ